MRWGWATLVGSSAGSWAEMTVTLEPIENFQLIRIDQSATPSLDTEQEQLVQGAWEALRTQNPKYFNSPMLSFESASPGNGNIIASVRPYMHHAVRDTIDLGISLLAVTAVVLVGDRVLIGKRSVHSHRYGGLWELGPSGGIDVPEHTGLIDRNGLLNEAVREVEEEAGFVPSVIRHDIVALIHDHQVGSTDLAVVMQIEPPETLSINWEYEDTRWLPLNELVAMCDEEPDKLIPTTIALARFLHAARA